MNIIITGASSGMGRECALALAGEKGNKVFALARRVDELNSLSKEAVAGKIIPVPFDLNADDFGGLDRILRDEGVDHIDILIHNAGLLIKGEFASLSRSDWEQVYGVNVIGVAMLTRHLLPKMGGMRHTHIVMIGSIGGVKGSQKFSGLSAYSSSKGGLVVLTECLAEEFTGRGISVNCLAMGAVQTEMLEKAFPGYVAKVSSLEAGRYISDFSVSGWRHFNGKILEVSTTNP